MRMSDLSALADRGWKLDLSRMENVVSGSREREEDEFIGPDNSILNIALLQSPKLRKLTLMIDEKGWV